MFLDKGENLLKYDFKEMEFIKNEIKERNGLRIQDLIELCREGGGGGFISDRYFNFLLRNRSI